MDNKAYLICETILIYVGTYIIGRQINRLYYESTD
jgi:hypothetical protein